MFDRSAEWYDVVYAQRDYARDVDFVRAITAKHGSLARTVLDLGCGTGQHLACWADAGCGGVGVELSAGLLKLAEDRLRAHRAEIDLVHGDAGSLELGRQFELVTALFHVLSYQTEAADVAALFACARRHLAPGGVALFDFWYGPAVLALGPEQRRSEHTQGGATLVRTATPRLDVARNVVEVRLDFEPRGVAGPPVLFSELHTLRYFFDQELAEFADAAGLVIRQTGAWLRDGPASPETWSAFVILAAR